MSFSVAQKLKKLLKIGVVQDSDDSISYPIIFAKFLGKVRSRAVNFTPFGVWNRPKDGMMSMLFNMNGNESNKFSITNELKDRPVKNLEKGEVVLGNLLSYFHFKEDGNIVLTIPTGKFLTINGSVVINGGLAINGEITTDQVGGKLKMTVTEFELVGLMTSTGKITAQDVVEGTDLIAGSSINFNGHTHGGVTTGGGNTTGPQ